MKINFKTLPLLGVLLAFMASDRARINYEFKTVPKLLKTIMIIVFAVFVTLVLVHGLDLLPDFLSIFNIQFP